MSTAYNDYLAKIAAAQFLGGGKQPELTTEGLRAMIHADSGLTMAEKTLLETAVQARAQKIADNHTARAMGNRHD